MAFQTENCFCAALAIIAAFGTVPASARTAPSPSMMPQGSTMPAPKGFVAMCKAEPALCAAGRSPVTPPASTVGTAWVATGFGDRGFWYVAATESRGGGAPIGSRAGTFFEALFGIPPHQPSKERPPVAAPVPDVGPVIAAPSDDRARHRLLRQWNWQVNRSVRQISDQARFGVDERWDRSGQGRGAKGDCEDIALEKRIALVKAGFDPAALRFAVGYSRASGLHTVLIARTGQGDLVLDSRHTRIMPWDRTPYVWLSVQSVEDPMRWHSLHPHERIVRSNSAEKT